MFWFVQIHSPLPCSLFVFRNGLARGGSEYGPITDLPDWSFAGELYFVFLTAKSNNVVLSPDVLCLSILFYASVVRCLSNSKSRNVNISSNKDLYFLLCDFQMEGLHLH